MFLNQRYKDLGLTLSLGDGDSGGPSGGPSSSKPTTSTTTTTTTTPFQLNPITIPSPSPTSCGFLHKLPCNTSTDSDKSYLRGIDVNRAIEVDEQDQTGVSSPNSTVSTVTGGKRNGVEADVDRTSSRVMSDEEDGSDNSRKKLRLSKDQSSILEDSFKEHSTLNPKQKLALARRLGLRPRQVEVWFQNRRARTKLKQTEVDCEFLKRCCEQLTEENRMLQKEVAELRTLKWSPHFCMHMTPPTTLTVCPSCEHTAVPPPPPDYGGHRGGHPWIVTAPVAIRPFEALQPG